MTSAQLLPAVIVPLIVWRVYVRVRRTIGRQPLAVNRLRVRVIIFAVVIALFTALSVAHRTTLLALGGGLALSLIVAWFAIRLTKFERTEAGDFFTPNTVIGVALSLVLIGRVAYRAVVLSQMAKGTIPPTGPHALQSPTTAAIFGLTLGFYVAYYAGILAQAKRLQAAA